MRLLALVILFIAYLFTLHLVHAKTVGERFLGPDESDYFATLMMPDSPGTSCCGEADVYWADDTATGPNGEVIAIVTDTRSDDRVLPDGREIHRAHVPPGTRITVPPSKIRRHPVANPTGHTIIFLGGVGEDPATSAAIVYCYEPQPLL